MEDLTIKQQEQLKKAKGLIKVFIDGDEVKTDTLIIADVFGKEHNKVIRDVRAVNCSEDFRQANFGQSEYLNKQGRKQIKYDITFDGFIFLVMGYTGKLAGHIKEAYINKFNEQKEENKRLVEDNTDLHKIATSDDKQKERQYQADKVRYSWKNIRTVLESCDYKTIEDEVTKIISFHTNDLKKRDRANYDSHQDANNTEYKQIVRDRVFTILDDITNTTLDGVLRAVTAELRVNVIKDKLSTTNRSNALIQSNLERQYDAIKPPSIDEYHVINYHPFSINSSYKAEISDKGEPYLTDTPAFKRWKANFPYGWTMPSKKEMNVDFDKPVRIHFYYDHMDKFDRSNFDKSAQDMIFKFYRADDQMVWETGVSKTNKHVDSYDEGKIYFYLENIQ